jgi:DNA-binding phage protein
MALTRDSRATVKARADRDAEFRAGLYQEAMQALVDGEFGVAKILLRDFINATVGFGALGARVGVPEKSLMRMFGPQGNPRAENLAAVVAALKELCGLSLTVVVAPVRRRRTRVGVKARGYLAERAARAKAGAFGGILAKAGRAEVIPGDELPEGWVVGERG